MKAILRITRVSINKIHFAQCYPYGWNHTNTYKGRFTLDLRGHTPTLAIFGRPNRTITFVYGVDSVTANCGLSRRRSYYFSAVADSISYDVHSTFRRFALRPESISRPIVKGDSFHAFNRAAKLPQSLYRNARSMFIN